MRRELASHGGDPHATLAATIDGRSLEAIGEVRGAGSMPTWRRADAAAGRRPARGATSCSGSSRRASPKPASGTR